MIDFNCMDCVVDTMIINEYYTVHDYLWLAANPADFGMLCIGCLETRLGRVLTKADFPEHPINMGVFEQSSRLRDRLTREW